MTTVGKTPPPSTLRWFRWREKWAWGYGEWKFVELVAATEKDAFEVLREDHANGWSDKWRGIEVEEILLPPREHLEAAIAGDRSGAAALLARAARYETLLASAEPSR